MKKFLLFLAISLSIFTISAYANKISPAIDIIANENSMVKASVLNDGEIQFDTSDFDVPLNTNVNVITISSLPAQSSGRLMLGNLYVVENQIIKREDFSLLKFVPVSNDVQDCSFTFEPNNYNYQIECTIKTLKNVNYSPSATNGKEISAWTQENISCYGTLPGYDPENDNLKFEIVSLPKKGIVTILDAYNGDYTYTPYKNSRGDDTFTYRVVDSFGNHSEECTVTVDVKKLRTSMVYNDTKDSLYQNAILVMAEHDLMAYTKNTDGSYSFNPKDCVTREEFLSLVMKAMGAKSQPSVEKTRFADDKEINNEYKGYVEAAFSLGIISGTFENDGLHFYPKKEITTAEAAVMINKIIGAKIDGSIPTFKDANEIPSWANEDISILCELGILRRVNGKINPNSPLTREQTAQILMSLLQYRGKLEK